MDTKLERSTLPELNRVVDGNPDATTIHLPDRFTRIVESVAADLVQGYNVHVMGSAGTGKSVLVRLATEIAMRRTNSAVALTAPTGIAARNIDGVTCHSFFGFPVLPDYTEWQAGKPSKRLRDYLRSAHPAALVIDEISMMRVDLFDQVASVLHQVNGKLAGPGLKLPVLAVGDMLQLPPVVNRTTRTRLEEVYGRGTDFLAVRSPYWDEMEWRCYELTEPLRQSADPGYFACLNAIRMGGSEGVEALMALVQAVGVSSPREDSAHILSRNSEVDAWNAQMLQQDPRATGPIVTSSRVMEPLITDGTRDWKIGVPSETAFREGSLVLVGANDKNGTYVNGDMGRIKKIRFRGNNTVDTVSIICTDGHEIEVEWADRPRTEAMQAGILSELLGYGGMPLGDIVEPVNELMHSTGLSRSFWRWNSQSIADAIEDDADVVPVSIANAQFMPLKLAYAFTVHKSQGQTMAQVDVDPSNFWDKGQLYVAISRCRTRDGLRFLRMPQARNYVVSNEARAFYQSAHWVRDDELRLLPAKPKARRNRRRSS